MNESLPELIPFIQQVHQRHFGRTPSESYNSIAVANWDAGPNWATYSVAADSNAGPTTDLRKKPEIAAPGTNIWSAALAGGYQIWQGTSFSAPHIAGALALLAQAGVTDSLGAKALLLNSAWQDGTAQWEAHRGWGYANLSQLWNAISDTGNNGAPANTTPGQPICENGLGSSSAYKTTCFYGWLPGPAGQGHILLSGTPQGTMRATAAWNRHVLANGVTTVLNPFSIGLYNLGGTAINEALSGIDNVVQARGNASGDVIARLSGVVAGPAERYGLAVSSGMVPINGPQLSLQCNAPQAQPTQPFTITCTATNSGDLAAPQAAVYASQPAAGNKPLGNFAPGATQTVTFTGTVPPPPAPPLWVVNVSSVGYGLTFGGSAQGQFYSPCSATVSQTSWQLGASGGPVTFTVMANPASCASQIQLNQPESSAYPLWIGPVTQTINAVAGTITYTFQAPANGTNQTLSGQINIGIPTYPAPLAVISIGEAPASSSTCTYTSSNSKIGFDFNAGTGAVTVTGTGTGCAAGTMTSDSPGFVHVSGLTYTVDPNIQLNQTTASRTFTLHVTAPATGTPVHKQDYTFTQAGLTCQWVIASPPPLLPAGGPVTLNVTIPTGSGAYCKWTATTDDANTPTMITRLLPGGTITGPQKVTFTVPANPGTTTRTANILIGDGQSVPVKQYGSGDVFAVTGKVTFGNRGVDGIIIAVSPPANGISSVKTHDGGLYGVPNLVKETKYTLTPQDKSYIYIPPSYDVTKDKNNADFTARVGRR